MFFIVDRSIIDGIYAGDVRARILLQDIITAIRDGSHLIRMDVQIATEIIDKIPLDDLQNLILKEYIQNAYELATPLPGIIEGRLLYWNEKGSPLEEIDMLRQGIELLDMDLSSYPQFKINQPSQLWGEGEADCNFMKKIGEAYKDKKDCHVHLSLKSRYGGGGTLADNLRDASSGKEEMHLAISDNDKKYDDGFEGITDYSRPTEDERKNLGDTAKKLLRAYPSLDPLIVKIYIYKFTSELENLIPWKIVKQLHSSHFAPEYYELIDRSFFDIKKGMQIKDLKSSQYMYDYWYPMLSLDAALKTRVDNAVANYDTLKNSYDFQTDPLLKEQAKKAFDNYKNTILLSGKKILKEIHESASHFQSLGKKETFSDLTRTQQSEWEAIGSLVMTYGASGRPLLN